MYLQDFTGIVRKSCKDMNRLHDKFCTTFGVKCYWFLYYDKLKYYCATQTPIHTILVNNIQPYRVINGTIWQMRNIDK